jgi:hypothetical protein
MGQYKLDSIKDSTGVTNIGLSPTGPTFPNGFGYSIAAGTNGETLANTAAPVRYYTPTADTDFVKLNSSWTTSQIVKISNKSATKIITVQANDGTTIATLYPKSSCEVYPNAATPVINTSWEGINPIVSDWADESSKIVYNGITLTTNSVFTRRVGDSYQFKGLFVPATVTAVAAQITLPNSLSIDIGKVFNDAASPFITQILGSGYRQSNGGALNYGTQVLAIVLFLDSSAPTKLQFAYESTTNGITGKPWNAWVNAGETQVWNAEIPILGWTSTKG